MVYKRPAHTNDLRIQTTYAYKRPTHTNDLRIQTTYTFFFTTRLSIFRIRQCHNNIMQTQTKETRIVLVIEVTYTIKKLSVQRATQIYKVSKSTICNRIKSCLSKAEKQNVQHILTENEEKTLVQYILDLDSQRFSPRLNIIRNITNLLYTTRRAISVGKQWPYNFIKCRSELKTRFSYIYDFQRILCENPTMLNVWFRLVANIYTKYII